LFEIFLIDNAEKTCLKVKELEIKWNEAIPENIRGKLNGLIFMIF